MSRPPPPVPNRLREQLPTHRRFCPTSAIPRLTYHQPTASFSTGLRPSSEPSLPDPPQLLLVDVSSRPACRSPMNSTTLISVHTIPKQGDVDDAELLYNSYYDPVLYPVVLPESPLEDAEPETDEPTV
ncbi:uncharacterized protein M6B38_115840 [Iris pallida]|uniref:Uncharacterized protein n=1 Tax=Iris pallida TaxID=29817 RepID=A0AAX6GXG3_IRIPA|nr:uncharacterized protein M6B38_339895 [Iris pallida]KAJ6848139.1 uncharacterized protein M6B38_115840 [Iris pallida]